MSGPAVDGDGRRAGLLRLADLLPGRAGRRRNAGAISESIGEYGGDVVLATPIEAILGDPVDAPQPRRARVAQPRRQRGRSLCARRSRSPRPLTVSGVSTAMGRALERAGAARGRPVLAAPAARSARFPPQPMRPGAAVGVSYSQGDIQVGAIGTVAYTDGDRVWAFGHPFESAGARARCSCRTPTSTA